MGTDTPSFREGEIPRDGASGKHPSRSLAIFGGEGATFTDSLTTSCLRHPSRAADRVGVAPSEQFIMCEASTKPAHDSRAPFLLPFETPPRRRGPHPRGQTPFVASFTASRTPRPTLCPFPLASLLNVPPPKLPVMGHITQSGLAAVPTSASSLKNIPKRLHGAQNVFPTAGHIGRARAIPG